MSVRQIVYNNMCDARSLHYIVDSIVFQESYALAGADERETVDKFVKQAMGDDISIREKGINALKDWIRKNDARELTVNELKEMAKQYGIINYSRLSRDQLLSAIGKARCK